MILSEKEQILEYIMDPYTTNAKNVMGCSENWYNPFFSIFKTFSRDEIEQMSETEISNLIKLANNIAEGLY